MIVGIDINILNRGGGIATYISQLLTNLKDLGQENEYKLYYNSFRKITMPVDTDFFHVFASRFPSRVLQFAWTSLRFPPIEWCIGNVDVFHSTAHSPIYAYSPPAKRWIVTVHDLFTFKLNYSREIQANELKILKIIDKEASRVIAVSHSTRNDLIEIMPSLASRTVVIHEGVDEKFFGAEAPQQTLEKYGIKNPYILYVGAGDAHKNLIRLINVYKRIANVFPHFLVLAGKITERYRPAIKHVEELKLGGRVIFTDSVAQDDIPAIYKGADLFVLPSLYEGFGLVLLEAMACGTPVVASKTSSIPEVIGDSGEFFDPYDEDSMYDACLKVLSDIERRQKMKLLGLKRVRQFTWRNMTEKTLKVYEEASRA